MWLQGGPGATSMFGLFDEIGPISVTEDGEGTCANPLIYICMLTCLFVLVVSRNTTWNANYSLVFFDNPVCKSRT